MSIGIRQAMTLAELMKRHGAHNATPETVVIHGIEAKVVVLDHVDREDDTWQSVHILDWVQGSACIGNVPKEKEDV